MKIFCLVLLVFAVLLVVSGCGNNAPSPPRPPENCLTPAQLTNPADEQIGMFFDTIKDIVESRCDGDYAAVRAHRKKANLLGIDEYWWILRRYNGLLWYPYRGVDVYRDDDLYTLPDCQGRPMQAVPARLQELVGCLNGKPVADPVAQQAIAALLRDWHQAQLSRNTNRICGFYGPDTSRVGFNVPPCPQLLDSLRPGAWAVPPKAITIDETQIHVVGPWADIPDRAIAPSPQAGGWPIGPLPVVLYRHDGNWKIVNYDVLLYGAAHPPMVFCLPFESTDQDNCRS